MLGSSPGSIWIAGDGLWWAVLLWGELGRLVLVVVGLSTGFLGHGVGGSSCWLRVLQSLWFWVGLA